MLFLTSVLPIFTFVSALNLNLEGSSNTKKTHSNIKDWSNIKSAFTAVGDPRIIEKDRFFYVVCTPQQTQDSKICQVIVEFPALNDTRIICNTTIHLSELGKVDPWPYIVPFSDKIIFPWIDSNDKSHYNLTIRSINIDTCITNDVSIRVGSTPLYMIVPFKNSFDILYVQSDDGLNFSTIKASYDQSGNPIDKPISIFSHIPEDAMQDENGFSYPFPHQLLPVSNTDPGKNLK
ncbi:hypothetical protein QAD02_023512 [Eretmocerus hayati]|uniref:Uncharacterized protein n=1 Tax=Eretmocerus hayati TaxID=131215 RepID=A0ACC2PXP1_9HYME|nr:hypothetical protein QAD02_023512 [Eretmocerus hayati]